MLWPLGLVQLTCQPLTGAEPAATVTSPWKPFCHWLTKRNVAEQAPGWGGWLVVVVGGWVVVVVVVGGWVVVVVVVGGCVVVVVEVGGCDWFGPTPVTSPLPPSKTMSEQL